MPHHSEEFHTIVLGLGGMGSAACYHLSKRGHSVLGIEQFGIAHTHGASFGESRIFRYSQFAGPEYVPLAIRAKELWDELEAYSDQKILHMTGGLDAGPEDGTIFPGALRSCEENGLQHEVLTPADTKDRFPAFSLPDHYKCLYQPDAGFLVPEHAISAHINAALSHSTQIRTFEKVIAVTPDGNGVTVETNKNKYRAAHLVLSGGAWTGEVLPVLKDILTPERGCVGWFLPQNPDHYKIGTCPIFIIDDGEESFYGFPQYGRPGFKIGANVHLSEYGTAEGLRRGVDDKDEARMRHFLTQFLPGGNGPMLAASDCVWTLTPDEHFILDTHPDYPHIAIAAGFSGYGFKFCPVVGEIMADLIDHGATRHEIGLHSLARFDNAAAAQL